MSTAPGPLPPGFGVRFDPGAVRLGEAVLYGGSPARVLRLSPAGVRALDELRAGRVRTPAGGVLARRLCDAGLLHPCPPVGGARPDVTVVVPVRDRAGALDRCLRALGAGYPVVVVDDASRDPAAVARVAAAHGARLVRREENGGPAAARNTGLALVTTEFAALLDSDCAPGPDWIERIAAHLTDPRVAAAAPRIVPLAGPDDASALTRYGAVAGSLDLGPAEAPVAPLTRVAYVPTAALVVRCAALAEVAGPDGAFDESLRYGEDVDLLWRLHTAGWRIRYDPAVRVEHEEPGSWRALLERRFRYGTSAPALALRHPGRVPPVVAAPGAAAAVGAALLGRPAAAGAAAALQLALSARSARRAGLPAGRAGAVALRGLGHTWLGAGRYAAQFAAPLLAAALLAPGSARTPAGRTAARRLAAAGLLLAPGLHTWATRRPRLDPVRFTLAALADDLAYGAGVCRASVRHRTLAAVTPALPPAPHRRTVRARPSGNKEKSR